MKDLLAQAASLPEAERAAFVERAAQGDRAVADEVRALLPLLRNDQFMAAPTFPEPLAAELPREAAGTRIGRYKLLQRIGEGGSGTVYMAEQTEPVVRRVALKIIKAGMDTRQVIARFEAERQALALMDHPSIARVLDGGATENGRPYFVMELVRGDPVTVYCDREQLSIVDRLQIFCAICNAVEHAHQKGIIHRDIKPSNVLVTVADGRPLPKVIDFGIAKATASRLTDKTLFTELRQLIGTPEYMSPEQAEQSGIDVDTRTDVYSLGVLLYELLTGGTPFDREKLIASGYVGLLRILREEEPPRPSYRLETLHASSALGGGNSKAAVGAASSDLASAIAQRRRLQPGMLVRTLRGDLDWIVLKCLDKERGRRYQTASELAADIRRFLAQQPVTAAPPSTLYRLQKFVRRHRAAVIGAATVAGALLLGVIGTTIGMVWAIQERWTAEEQRTLAQVEAQRANREADQARVVNEFMRDVFTSLDPVNQRADTWLKEVLDNASNNAAQQFAGHPLQEAQVRDLLGQIYNHLSMWPAALEQFRIARRLWEAQAGPDDARYLESTQRYAGVAINMDHVREAEAVLSDLRPRAERVLGPDDRLTLGVRRSAAIVDMMRGREAQAERELLALLGHPQLVNDDGLRARVLQSLVSLRLRRMNASPDRAELLAQVEPLVREYVDHAGRAFGPQSGQLLQAKTTLARVLVQQGKHAEAAEICQEILDLAANRLGECHFVVREALDVLSDCSHQRGDASQAAELCLRVLNCQRQQVPPGSPSLLGSISDALRYLDRAGRDVEGEALARELVAELADLGGGHGDLQFGAKLYVARFVAQQGRLDEAAPLFQELLDQDLPAEPFRQARLSLFYAGYLVRRGQYDEAEQRLTAAAEILGDIRIGTWATHRDDVILGFIELYEATNRPDKVAEYRKLQQEALALR